MADFGKVLLEARIRAGLTRSDVFLKTGIPAPTLQVWELNGTDPRFSAVCKLARLYGISLDELTEKLEAVNESSV